jgi:alpha-ketoglutarate-dependent taurine dioxygenase
MNVRYSAGPLGAEITGVDLAQALDQATFRAIEDVFHDRGVIVFRDEQLTEEQHIIFSAASVNSKSTSGNST